jgi:hypothetical protein
MISKFHIITSESTAGAAELLIMGMQQYVDVRLVGEQTAGDFYLSSIFPFSSTNSSIELVTGLFGPNDKMSNDYEFDSDYDSDYDSDTHLNHNFHQSFNWTTQNECGVLCADMGFSPNLQVISHETWMTMKNFGDITEEFLHATLTGQTHSSPSSRRKLKEIKTKMNKKRGIALM